MFAPTWAFAMLMSQTFAAEPVSPTPAREFRDVEYAQAGGASLRLDGYVPAGQTPVPAALIVHGGGWVRGDRRANVEPLFQPLAEAGFAWFSISYTLAANPLQVGEAVSDVEAAMRYLRAHAKDYRIDPERLVLVGESAGGQLASMAALGSAGGSFVKAVVAIYTPTDLVALARTSAYIPENIRKQLNGTPWEKLILARLGQLSPIGAVRAGMPPFLFIHGDADPVVPIAQSKAMCDQMQTVGAACELITVPGGGHGLRRWDASTPYRQQMVEWLQQQLR